MKVTVKRSNWYRGKGSASSMLLRSGDGKMCCLGFAALACGYDPKDIIATSGPLSMSDFSKWPTNPAPASNDANYGTLMRTNDFEHMTDEEREARLIEEGKAVGLEFEFEA